jgi:hypothetical protein
MGPSQNEALLLDHPCSTSASIMKMHPIRQLRETQKDNGSELAASRNEAGKPSLVFSGLHWSPRNSTVGTTASRLCSGLDLHL